MTDATKGKSPVQSLVDEITLLRHDFEKLRGSHPSKEEAALIAKTLMESAELMSVASQKAEKDLSRLAHRAQQEAFELSRSTASRAIKDVEASLRSSANQTFDHYRTAAEEARRTSWRYFGGFWVWLLSMLALGALIGALTAFWVQGLISAKEFGDYPRIFCSSAGGETGTTEDGGRYCVFFYD